MNSIFFAVLFGLMAAAFFIKGALCLNAYYKKKKTRAWLYGGLCLSVSGFLLCLFGAVDQFYTYTPLAMAVWCTLFWICGGIAIGCSICSLLARGGGHFEQEQLDYIVRIVLVFCLFFGAPFLAIQSLKSRAPVPVKEDAPEVTVRGKTYTYPAYNLTYTLPDEPWMELNVKKWSADTLISFYRTNPNTYFQIIAETGMPVEPGYEEIFAEFIYGQLSNNASKNRLLEKTTIDVAGITGHCFFSEYTPKTSTQKIKRIHWLGGQNGFYYQFLVWTPDDVSPDKLFEEFNLLMQGVAVIDPAAKSEAKALDEDFISKDYCYAVRAKGTAWKPWSVPLQEGTRLADCRLAQGQDTALLVLPFAFQEAPPPLSILAPALLNYQKIDFNQIPAGNIRQVKSGDYEGFDIDYFQKINDLPFDYRIRLLRGAKFVYYFSAAKVKNVISSSETALHEARNMFEPLPPGPLPDLAKMKPEDRDRHALGYAWIAHAYYDRDLKETGFVYLKKAHSLQPDNSSLLAEVLNGFMDFGFYEDGLKYAEQYKDACMKNVGTRKQFAALAMKANQWQLAMDLYGGLISGGDVDEEILEAYVRLSLGKREEGDIYQKIQTMLGSAGGLQSQLIFAAFLDKQKQHAAALDLLRTLYKGQPRDETVRMYYFSGLLEQERYNETIEESQKYLKEVGATPDVLFYQGYSFAALKRYGEALAVFVKARNTLPESAWPERFVHGLAAIQKQADGVKIIDDDFAISRQVRIENKDLIIREKIVFKGSFANDTRQIFDALGPEQIEPEFKSMLASAFGRLDLEAFQVDGTDRPGGDIAIQYTYRISEGVGALGTDRLLIELPLRWEQKFLWANVDSPYGIPMVLIFPWRLHSTMIVDYPKGFQPQVNLDAQNTSRLPGACLDSENKVTREKNRVIIEGAYTLIGGVYSIKKYEACQDEVTAEVNRSAPKILLSATGESASQ